MSQFVVQVTVIGGLFDGFEGFALSEDGYTVVNCPDMAGRFSRSVAEQVVIRFINHAGCMYAAEVLPEDQIPVSVR